MVMSALGHATMLVAGLTHCIKLACQNRRLHFPVGQRQSISITSRASGLDFALCLHEPLFDIDGPAADGDDVLPQKRRFLVKLMQPRQLLLGSRFPLGQLLADAG